MGKKKKKGNKPSGQIHQKEKAEDTNKQNKKLGTSLVVQLLRIHVPLQGRQV